MLEVMRCLDDELRQSPAPDVKAYKVFRVLLDASINALERGTRTLRLLIERPYWKFAIRR